MKHTGINCRGTQVVRGCYGMNITGQVQVKIFHWNDL